MSEQINYEHLLPKLPEEDIVGFAREQGAFRTNYLIYRHDKVYNPMQFQRVETVRVTCTCCGTTCYMDKHPVNCPQYARAPFGWWNSDTKEAVISGDQTVCPCCGCAAKTVHIGEMRSYNGEIVEDAWVSVLKRLPVEGERDRLALLDWCIRRCINKNGQTRMEIWPFTAWVVEEKKIVRLMGFLKNIGGSFSLFGEWKQRKQFRDDYDQMRYLMPWDPAMLEGTTAENCKLDLYIKAEGKRLVRYLALWRRRPAVENLLVQDCGHLVRDWIDKEAQSGSDRSGVPKIPEVNWKEKRPARMLGLNMEEFRRLRQDGWSTADLDRYRLARDAGLTVRLPADMELLRTAEVYNINRMLEEHPKAEFWRTLRYLGRQKADWSTLRDYWRMAEQDGMDLTDNLVRWPRNLIAAHRRQIDERLAVREREKAEQERALAEKRAKEREARRPLFAQRAAELERYTYKLDGLLIRPCADENELIAEGKALHHCVANYAQDHAEGKTAIFFIRKTSAPDEPFYTLEFDEKAKVVQQNRGLRNCDRTEEVVAFEAAWLDWVRSMKRVKVCAKSA